MKKTVLLSVGNTVFLSAVKSLRFSYPKEQFKFLPT